MTVGADPVCTGTKVYTFTYTDCNNVDYTWTYTYTISAPTVTLPADGGSTVACVADAVVPVPPVVTDNCGRTLVPSAPVVSADPACIGTKVYTFTYTDCNNVDYTWTYTYTISAPTVTLPADGGSTVACVADAVTPTAPTVTDNCGRPITPTMTAGADPACAGTKVYTFTYTDCNNVDYTWTYTYTISAPTVTLPADGGSTVACVADAVTPTAPTVTDNCGRPITPTMTVGNDPACTGTKVYTFTYTDCNNVDYTWTYTYTISAPTVTLPADGASVVACVADAVVPVPPVVTDNCGRTLVPSAPVVSTDPSCGGTKTYEFTYTDCSGASQTWVYTYTFPVPEFTLPANGSAIINCLSEIMLPVAPLVLDACGEPITPVMTESPDPVCAGEKIYSFTYSNCAGQPAIWTFIYSINPPTVVLPANASSTVSCVTDAIMPIPPAVTDNCGRNIIPVVSVGDAPECSGEKIYTFTYTDCADQTYVWIYTYFISIPAFTIPDNGFSTVSCIADAAEPTPPVVSDNCGRPITPTMTEGGNPACTGTKVYTFSYTDCNGVTRDWVYTYTIDQPSFELPANDGLVVPCVAAAVEPTPPVVTDNCGRIITPSLVISADPVCSGEKTYTYSYTDCSGSSKVWIYTYTISTPIVVMPENASTTISSLSEAQVLPVPPVVLDNCNRSLDIAGPTISADPVCNGTKVYTWIYTDCSGDTYEWTYTYNLVSEIIAITPTITNTTCTGSTGAVEINVTGGTAPYTYEWNTGATTKDLSNLATGTYTVTVTDANGCTATLDVPVATDDVTLTITELITAAICTAENGAIDVSVTGGTAPYTYSWNTGSTDEDLTNLAPGSYTVTITDANGCTAEKTIEVTQDIQTLTITPTITNTTCTGSTGAVEINVTGGTAPYTYEWNTGATTKDLSNLATGTYTVTVTDANGCTATLDVPVATDDVTLTITELITAAICTAENGAIDVSVTGGTAPYTYSWNTGSTDEDLTNLAPGSYTVTITDANGCTAEKTIEVTQDIQTLTITPTITNTTCTGSTGAVEINVTGGTAPYTYEWNTGATTKDLSNLATGTYTVTVTDANGCTATLDVPVATDDVTLTITELITAAICTAENGAIDVSVTGGTAPYTYSWNTGSTDEDLTNLAPGSYTVTITDANGCTAEKTIAVTQDIQTLTITPTITNTTCTGSTGAVEINVTGGTAPYTYEWNTGATTKDLSNLATGTYTVTVTDANGCTATLDVPVATDDVTLTITELITAAICTAENGSIDLSVEGGTAPYTYSWNTGSTDEDLTNLAPGSYTVTITDANGCTAEKTIEVTQDIQTLTITPTVTNTTCTGSTGAVEINVTGGTAPYTYEWNTGATTKDLSNLATGTYTVTVTDANGCTAQLNITVGQNISVIDLNLSAPDITCDKTTGTITVTAQNGTAPYSYSIDGGVTYQSSNLFNDLDAGNYTIHVKDANNCTAQADVELGKEFCCTVTLSANAPVIACDQSSGTITATASLGFTPYQFSIDGGVTYQNSNTFTNLPAGTYTVQVKDAKDCIAQTSVTIDQLIAPVMLVTNPAAVCAPATVDITNPAVTAGSDVNLSYTYWTNAAATSSLLNPSAVSGGTYYIRGAAANGCFVVLPVTVTVNTLPILVTVDQRVCAPGTVDLTTPAVTAGSDANLSLTYWMDANATQPMNNPTRAGSGTYYIKAVNTNDCEIIKPVTVTVMALPVLITSNQSVCAPATVDLTSQAVTAGSDANLNLTYWMDANATQPMNNPARAGSGTYYIKATAASGCYVIKSVDVTILPLPTLVTIDQTVCAPATVDLTSQAVTAGSDANLVFTYWTDQNATRSLNNPSSVNTGTYYIRAEASTGCAVIRQVSVTVIPLPDLVTNNQTVCAPATVDLTNPAVTNGSESGLNLTYWADQSATQPLNNPSSVSSGTYYIRAIAATGCEIIRSVVVTVNPQPNLVINDPAPVCAPGNINLTAASVTSGSDANLTLSYWRDINATQTLNNANSVTQSGTYYIRAINSFGCSIVRPVNITVWATPALQVTNPPAVCTPSTVDITSPAITTGSDASLSLSYWMNANATNPLNNPNAISQSGTYFIRAVNGNGCITIKPVTVTVNALPEISVDAPDSLCLGLSTNLVIRFKGQAPFSFTYSDGSQTHSVNNINSDVYRLNIKPTATTTYTMLSATDRNCTNTVQGIAHTVWITLPIDGKNLPPVFTTSNTPTQLQGRNIGDNYNMFNWFPPRGLSRYNIIDPVFNYDKRTEYKIEMRSEAGCVTVDTMRVEIINSTEPGARPTLHVPTVWTPNGDGRNDLLFPFTINVRELRHFRVFNRWGELVYETKTIGQGWNGYYKGAIQPIDTYTWTAEAVGINGEIFKVTGLVALMR
nr:T9SS type B sorting domain-containing protein [Flavihumibacter stibioxidans]